MITNTANVKATISTQVYLIPESRNQTTPWIPYHENLEETQQNETNI